MTSHAQMRHTATEYLRAIDTLQHASDYIAQRYSNNMPPAEARAHFKTRAILLRKRLDILNESEAHFGIAPPEVWIG